MNIEGIVKKSTAVFLALVMVISPIVDAPWSSLFSSSVLAEGIPAQVEHCCSSGVCTDDHSHGGDIEGELVSLSAADLPEVLAAMIEEMEAANSMMNLVPTSDVNFGDLIRAEHSAGFPTRIGGATITPVEQDGNHVVHGNGRLLWELRISFDVAFVDANGNPTPIGVPGNIPGTLEFEFRFALDDPDDLYILGAPTPLPEVRSRDVVYVNVPAHGTFIRVRGVAGGPQGELFNTNFASISQPNANGEVEFSGDLGNAHNSVHAFESFFRVHFTYGLPPGDGSEPKFPQMFCWNCEMTPWGDEYEIKPVTCVTDGIRRTTRTCVHPRLCANVDHVDRYYPLASGHNMQVVSEASPTCTEDGHIRRTCSSCGIEETDIFPALTHIWGNWSETTYVDPNASICVRHGIQTRHCTRDDCNDFETRNIYAAGHSFPPGEYTIVIHATCRQPGLATGRCSVCGDDNPDGVVLPPLGPDWGEWGIPIPATCFTPEYRTRSCIRPNCDCEDAATEREYLLPARAHDWGAWSVELQPGCITPGIEIRHCTHSSPNCDHHETRPIAALGHSDIGVWIFFSEATCFIPAIEHEVCIRPNCNHALNIRFVGSPRPHDWGYWEESTPSQNCMTPAIEARFCVLCGSLHPETREGDAIDCIIPVEINDVRLRATCRTDGAGYRVCLTPGCTHDTALPGTIPPQGDGIGCAHFNVQSPSCLVARICNECGVVHGVETGHSFIFDRYDPAPTCTEGGYRVERCQHAGCNEERVESLSHLGHTQPTGNWIINPSATCDEPGRRWEICSRPGCDYVISEEVIPQLSCDFNTIIIPMPPSPTCYAEGGGRSFCGHGCGRYVDVPRPMLPHITTVAYIYREPTCMEYGIRHLRCVNFTQCDYFVLGEPIPPLGHLRDCPVPWCNNCRRAGCPEYTPCVPCSTCNAPCDQVCVPCPICNAPCDANCNYALPTLSGNVAISGIARYGELLTANTAGLTSSPAIGDLGILTIQWLRGNTVIPGATGVTYTVAASDIGSEIRFRVSAANTEGQVTSPATSTISRAPAPLPPAPPQLESTTLNSITLVVLPGMEFRLGSGGAWTSNPTFTNLNPDTDYTFYARIAQTSTHYASSPSAPVTFQTGIITVPYNARLTALSITPGTLNRKRQTLTRLSKSTAKP